jgi:hypothetical protein
VGAMGMFSIWKELGFKANPYSQTTLRADALGDRLLAGRDKEIELLIRELGDSGAHPSVEGPIGAGKTSMINVAIYRIHQLSIEANAQELYLPAVSDFQPLENAAQFERDLYYVLAQTLIKHHDDFERVGLPTPDVRLMNRWLNEYQYTSKGGGVSTPAGGAQANWGSEPNPVVTESGFQRNVRQLLDECFPEENSGGIVCVLDNLEILQTAGKARETLDELRDKVFDLPQVRWVISGSRGIISRAKSEKLSGVMLDPMILKPIGDTAAADAITRRIQEYGTEYAVAPVSPDAFDFLYQTFNRNLREALARAGAFSRWFHDHYVEHVDETIPDVPDRDALVESWLMDIAELGNEDAKSVRPRHWTFFEQICANGGRAGSSEFETYGFNAPNLSTAVTELVNANLMVRELDPDNGQKSINSVTPAGWLVYFFRKNFPTPEETDPETEDAVLTDGAVDNQQ